MNQFSLMARFNAWANDRIYDSVAALSDDDYRIDRKAFFGSIHGTLNHLLVVDRLWTRRIEGVDHGIAALDQILCDDLETLRAARVEEDARLVAQLDGLGAAQLRAPITYRRMLGTGEQQTRCDHILLTLFNHQTHHRGQVHCMLTQSGITPPSLDIIFLLEELGLS